MYPRAYTQMRLPMIPMIRARISENWSMKRFGTVCVPDPARLS
ncbi:MAG: hypothetical protein A4E40_00778 [Methanoregulaceae archaeon PtaU1.Bin059]|nr:MAG: hypothetical protein A4E40_00778 [Methanoregulaceae archaeon PtaU1.Bin059]